MPLKIAIRFLFMTKNHIERIIFTLEGRGTNSRVLVSIRALNSSAMANFQFGSENAVFGLRGRGNGVTVEDKLNCCLGLNIPCMLRVVMDRKLEGVARGWVEFGVVYQ